MKKRYHKNETIANWKKNGVISNEYDKLYYKHMSINNCELCNVEFDKIEFKNQRCLDHDHITGEYRKTLCRACNANYKLSKPKTKSKNSSGFSWIQNQKTKNKSGNYSFTWRYHRKINEVLKRKCFKTLSKAIAFSFIQILKDNPFYK